MGRTSRLQTLKDRCSEMPATRAFDLKGRLDQAISRIVAVRVDGESARLSLPILYPSGSGCTLEIMFNGERCFVSDLGLGHLEAEMQGADGFYDGCAKVAAGRFGVGYDGFQHLQLMEFS